MEPDPELREIYESAIFEVQFPAGAVQFRAGEGASGAPPEPFAGITAWNPGHERPTPARNEAANRELEADLAALGLYVLPAAGFDPRRTHVEPSFAVFGISIEDALELARCYRQAAIVWWDGERATVAWVR